ncbi:hypothetical protein HPB48_022845 [Haemaphysalis longicornis]|uniref:Gag-like protein n=1 Tax=Haemaphysalis longicornis TaxID=44386 RepID=A0A9J6FLT0_HAELO|nr:hypothetical protein HPB48_022845 [Haemaphysalis longicornis]
MDRGIQSETGASRSLSDTSAILGTSEKTEQLDTDNFCKRLENSLEENDNNVVFKKPLEPKAPHSSRATRWGAPPLASLPTGHSIGKTFSDAQKRRVEEWVSSVADRASSLGATPDVLSQGPSNFEEDLASSSFHADVSKKDPADNGPKDHVGGEHSQINTKYTEKTIPLISGVLKLHAKVEDENAVAVPGPSGGPALITPLPQGQFYNVKPSQNGRPPRAIYRKKDTDGVPVVFTSKIPDVSFWDLNPNHFARDLRAVAGDDIASHRMTNYGSLVVYVKTGEVAHKLLKLTNVAELPVTVHVPKSYSKNLGKIRTVPFHYTDSNLVTLLARVGVVKARRQMKTFRTREGTNLRRSRSSVVLTFRDDIELPAFVRLGFFKFPVEPYVEAPLQCRNCQGFWHSSKGCRREARCRTCAGPHHFSVCTFKTRPRCANCRGPHTAIHFRCPVKVRGIQEEMLAAGAFLTLGIRRCSVNKYATLRSEVCLICMSPFVVSGFGYLAVNTHL